jgi:hypothetical protein
MNETLKDKIAQIEATDGTTRIQDSNLEGDKFVNALWEGRLTLQGGDDDGEEEDNGKSS